MASSRKRITIVLPCFNEQENVVPIYEAITNVTRGIPDLDFDILFVDNDSTDNTPTLLRSLAKNDARVKVIFNARNFGHIRSPAYGLMQADSDAAIYMASDFQDPPQYIADFIKHWENGSKVVMAVKETSDESWGMFTIRKSYYSLIARISDVRLVKNSTGFGLYDRRVLELMREINDPYPYMRGLVSEIGFTPAIVVFEQPTRRRGISKNNFYTLYDMAMLGITSHTKVPLRLATMLGFGMSAFGFFLATGYLIAKLIFWNSFALGQAATVIGMFLFFSVQLFFTGLLGEYIGTILIHVMKRPIIVEKERLNFSGPPLPLGRPAAQEMMNSSQGTDTRSSSSHLTGQISP